MILRELNELTSKILKERPELSDVCIGGFGNTDAIGLVLAECNGEKSLILQNDHKIKIRGELFTV